MHLSSALFPANGNGSDEFRQRWSREFLTILGIHLEAGNHPVPPGTLLVANHVSWLDVLVLSALCPADFVAKAEIRRWPLLGRLAARKGALFVDRRVGRHLLRLNAEIGERLAGGRVVAFFPEGTTSDGAGLLPFRPALFEPAVRGAHPVQPFALTYRDASGRRCAQAAFIGEQTLWASLLAIASLPELVAVVVVAPPLRAAGLARNEVARRARTAVQNGLAAGSLAGLARSHCARSSSGTRSRMNSLSS